MQAIYRDEFANTYPTHPAPLEATPPTACRRAFIPLTEAEMVAHSKRPYMPRCGTLQGRQSDDCAHIGLGAFIPAFLALVLVALCAALVVWLA